MGGAALNLRLIDGSSEARALDLASELFHRINRVIPPDQELLTVPPKCSVREAVALMRQHEGITLEGTYTGKTLAALLADAERRYPSRDGVVLFWNSYNSRDLSAAIAGLDYHRLPRPLHWYFEHDVQPLDRPEPKES